MQKIELKKTFTEISKELNSTEVKQLLSGQENITGQNIMNAVIDSKSGYDRLVKEGYESTLNLLNAQEIYDGHGYQNMLRHITAQNVNNPHYYRGHNTISNLYALVCLLQLFEKSFDELAGISPELFDNGNLNFDSLDEKGIVFLEIINDQLPSLKAFNKVVASVNELVDSLVEFFNLEEDNSVDTNVNIILIDSGSPINFVLKVGGPKVSKAISQIIEEAWLWLTNREGFELKKFKKNLREKTLIAQQIDEAFKNGLIEEITAEKLKRSIGNSVEQLLLNNTLTKKIAIEIETKTNREELVNMNKTLLLASGEKDNQDDNEN